MTELRVIAYEAAHRDLWDTFVASSKNGTFLFQRAFMDYHADRFTDASTLVLDGRARVRALFPANISGTRISSHAGLSYGGMISDDSMGTPLAVDIFETWLEYCRARGISDLVYKAVPPFYHRAPADEDRYALFFHGAEIYRRDVTSVVDLADRAPVQERRRRGIRRAMAAGLVVRESNGFEPFWAMLADNLASRHGARPVHTVEELRLLQGRFPSQIRLFTAHAGDRLCAGTLLFFCGPVVHAQYIASTEEGRQQGGLDLLFHDVMDRIRPVARYFDFGNSNENEGRALNRGLIEFKESFGARAVVQDFFRLRLTS